MKQDLQILLSLICFVLFILWNYKYYINRKEEFFKVTVVDNKAYWMYNNKLYTSNIINNKVDVNSKKQIDSMGMSENDIHDILERM